MTEMVTLSCSCDRCGIHDTLAVAREEWQRFEATRGKDTLEGWGKLPSRWGCGHNIYCPSCLPEARREMNDR